VNTEALSLFLLEPSVTHSYYFENKVSQVMLLIIKKFLTHDLRFEELRFHKDTTKLSIKEDCNRVHANIKLPSKSAYLLSHTSSVAHNQYGADVEKTHKKMALRQNCRLYN
jgi:hypothetical protein